MQRTGAQIIWECLVHEGVRTVFGYPGGAILPAYDAMLDYPIRHVLVRHEQGATHMADGYARASGEVGVGDRHFGSWSHQSRHRHCNRADGFVADGLHHRPGAEQDDRLRRVPGDRHHRHHAADHEAQLPRDARRRHHADDEGGVPPGEVRTSRAGARRHHEGRAAGRDRMGMERRAGEDARLPGESRSGEVRDGEGRRADSRLAQAADPRGAGRDPERRDEGAPRVRGADRRAGGGDAARHRRLPGQPSARTSA